MTTAVLATYYPPRRRLTVSYAGHPRAGSFARRPAPGHRSARRHRRLGNAASPIYRWASGSRRPTAGIASAYLPATACSSSPTASSRPYLPTTRRLTRAGSRPCSTGKQAPATTLRVVCWRPSTHMRRATNWARRRDVSARGVRRRSARARLVARVQASCSGTERR